MPLLLDMAGHIWGRLFRWINHIFSLCSGDWKITNGSRYWALPMPSHSFPAGGRGQPRFFLRAGRLKRKGLATIQRLRTLKLSTSEVTQRKRKGAKTQRKIARSGEKENKGNNLIIKPPRCFKPPAVIPAPEPESRGFEFDFPCHHATMPSCAFSSRKRQSPARTGKNHRLHGFSQMSSSLESVVQGFNPPNLCNLWSKGFKRLLLHLRPELSPFWDVLRPSPLRKLESILRSTVSYFLAFQLSHFLTFSLSHSKHRRGGKLPLISPLINSHRHPPANMYKEKELAVKPALLGNSSLERGNCLIHDSFQFMRNQIRNAASKVPTIITRMEMQMTAVTRKLVFIVFWILSNLSSTLSNFLSMSLRSVSIFSLVLSRNASIFWSTWSMRLDKLVWPSLKPDRASQRLVWPCRRASNCSLKSSTRPSSRLTLFSSDSAVSAMITHLNPKITDLRVNNKKKQRETESEGEGAKAAWSGEQRTIKNHRPGNRKRGTRYIRTGLKEVYKEKGLAKTPALVDSSLRKQENRLRLESSILYDTNTKKSNFNERRRTPELNRTPTKARSESESVSWSTTNCPPDASDRGSVSETTTRIFAEVMLYLSFLAVKVCLEFFKVFGRVNFKPLKISTSAVDSRKRQSTGLTLISSRGAGSGEQGAKSNQLIIPNHNHTRRDANQSFFALPGHLSSVNVLICFVNHCFGLPGFRFTVLTEHGPSPLRLFASSPLRTTVRGMP